MASNPDDFLRALIGTTGMRPIQEVQQGQQQLAQGNQQLQIGQMQIAQAQQKAAQDAAFQQDTQAYFSGHLPLSALVARYPQQAEQIQKANKVLEEPVRKSRITQFGSIYNAAKSNRPDLLVRSLESIRAAEKDQGVDTSEVDDAISAINSGDKNAIGYAQRFAEMNLAALDPEFAKSVGVGKDDTFTLSQGQTRFDASGNPLASLAPKPEYLVVPEGGMAVPINGAPALAGGGDPGTVAPVQGGGDIVARMIPITLGAEGGGTLANPKVSPKGARGPMQVMPGTNTDPGFGVRPAQDGSEAERTRVGRDYLSAMVRRYDDPAKAWAAYNAGPGAVDAAVQANGASWLQALPAETKKYVARNMSQLQRSGPTGSGVAVAPRQSGPDGTIYGRPKRGWVTMSPSEVAAQGLDAGTTYQRGPDGQIQPVSGQKQQYRQISPQEARSRGLPDGVLYQEAPDGKVEAVPGQRSAQLKPIPQTAVKAIIENRGTLRQIDSAISALQSRPKSIGPGTGMLGDTFTQFNDPEGTTTRAALGKIAGQIIHDVSGAAVTLSEEPRFKPYVPLVTDRPEVALQKLRQLRSLAQNTLSDFTDYYSEDQGYRPYDAGGGQGGAAPKRVRSIQEAQKLPPGTRYIRPDGKVMVR